MRAFGWVALLAWAGFLYWGVKATTNSISACTLVGDLPQNHLLSTADLKSESSSGVALYTGLYLRRALPKGSLLKAEDVSDSPLLRIAPDSTIFELDLSGEDANKHDADQRLDLGTGSTVVAKQSRVIAILCPSKSSGKCKVMFEIPQSALKPLADATGPVAIIDTSKVAPQQTGANVAADSEKTEKEKANTAVKKPGQK